jgi:ABC-type multidrug transport system ATPase subunit
LSAIIETQNLSKNFGSFQAVDDLSFTIEPGDVYGFLGQNGAGKSTTMRMILGLIRPSQGKVFIKGTEFNQDRVHLLQYIGAIIERPDMYGYLTGWDNLKMFAKLSNKKIGSARLEEVLELVGLRGREKDKVKAYSQGMKQRLGIAIALVHSPELLILDEPTNGLDPQGIAEMRQLILHLSKEHGKTILVSSHLLHEIEQIANRMIIIHKGKKIVEGNVHELLNPEDSLVEVFLHDDERIRTGVTQSAWGDRIQELKTNSILFKMNPGKVPELNKWLVNEGAQITEIVSKHTLEDYFINLTNDTAAKN